MQAPPSTNLNPYHQATVSQQTIVSSTTSPVTHIATQTISSTQTVAQNGISFEESNVKFLNGFDFILNTSMRSLNEILKFINNHHRRIGIPEALPEAFFNLSLLVPPEGERETLLENLKKNLAVYFSTLSTYNIALRSMKQPEKDLSEEAFIKEFERLFTTTAPALSIPPLQQVAQVSASFLQTEIKSTLDQSRSSNSRFERNRVVTIDGRPSYISDSILEELIPSSSIKDKAPSTTPQPNPSHEVPSSPLSEQDDFSYNLMRLERTEPRAQSSPTLTSSAQTRHSTPVQPTPPAPLAPTQPIIATATRGNENGDESSVIIAPGVVTILPPPTRAAPLPPIIATHLHTQMQYVPSRTTLAPTFRPSRIPRTSANEPIRGEKKRKAADPKPKSKAREKDHRVSPAELEARLRAHISNGIDASQTTTTVRTASLSENNSTSPLKKKRRSE